MNKEKLYGFANNKDEKLLVSRLVDVFEGANRSGYVKTSKFLNGREQNIAKALYQTLKADYSFYGGYDDAERKIVVCFSDDSYKEFFEAPIKVLDIMLKDNAKLNHRDYLGTLMGLGIKREMFGDILCDEKGAKIFVIDEIVQYVSDQLIKVGNHGVSVKISEISDITIPERKFKEINFTVGNVRLDAIVSGCTGISRSNASALINAGNVTVNWEEITSISKILADGDVISIKGHGRFLLENIGGKTRKDRIFIKVKKFI